MVKEFAASFNQGGFFTQCGVEYMTISLTLNLKQSSCKYSVLIALSRDEYERKVCVPQPLGARSPSVT